MALVTASAASIVFAFASPASANLVGPGGLTCSSVSFYYTLFPAGSTTTGTETVTIGGTLIASQPFTFSGTIFTDTFAITVPGGTHTVTATSNWTNTVDGAGSGTFSVTLTCGGGPPPQTTFFCNQPNTPTTCSPGYWKKHVTLAVLPQTLGNYPVTTVTEAVAVLKDTGCNTPIDCLALELLAALLNGANGLPTSCIQGVISDAQSILVTVGYNGPGNYDQLLAAVWGPTANSLALTLDTYNGDHTTCVI
jgi:hypothetical protein